MKFHFGLLLLAGFAAPVAAEEAACAQLQYTQEPLVTSDDEKVVLTADRATLESGGLSLLSGSVRLIQGDREFSAESVEYDREQTRVRINAESLFRNNDLIVRSRRAEVDLADETASFFGTEFTVPARAARGTAENFTLSARGRSELGQVTYTTCAPGSRAWLLEAGSIRFDPEQGLGTARQARLSFGRVPFLYLPYFQFPIDQRRRTGFLFPTVGNSDTTGLDFRWPYYLNLAPNYDATFTPRFMGERGLQLAGGLRYLLPRKFGEGQFNYEHLDRDRATREQRRLFEYGHRGLINRRLALEAQFAEASDGGYLEDFGGRMEAASITHLERSARLTYVAPAAYTITTLVQDFQTVDRSVAAADDPYRRLPVVGFETQTRKEWHGLRAGFSGEFANFEHLLNEQGQRLDLQPYLFLREDRSAWYVQAQADYRHTEYQLIGRTAGLPQMPLRSLPLFSAEGGLRFERITGGGSLQTLEPRLAYLYVPLRQQDDLPAFDSGEPDFDFVQLFARNRFSGEDRVADANQVAAAFITRLLDPADGEVRLSASLGQLYRFQVPQVALPPALQPAGTTPPRQGGTDYLAGLDYRLSSRWTAHSTVQYAGADNLIRRNAFRLAYRDANRHAALNYRYRRDFLEQADLSAATPVYRGWNALGRWRFSLFDDQTLEALGGIEYDTCCWALRTFYRRYIANVSGEFSDSIYLQLELKGLSRLGAGVEDFEPEE